MAVLSATIAAMRTALADLAGDEAIPLAPPDQIGAYPRVIIYPQPDTWTLLAHGGENGRPLYGGDHTIVVEWHTTLTDLAEAVTATIPVADAIPAALFQGFHADRLDGSVTTLRAIRCETFGELGWGSDQTFGVRMLVDVTIYEEVPS